MERIGYYTWMEYELVFRTTGKASEFLNEFHFEYIYILNNAILKYHRSQGGGQAENNNGSERR